MLADGIKRVEGDHGIGAEFTGKIQDSSVALFDHRKEHPVDPLHTQKVNAHNLLQPSGRLFDQ